MTLDEFRDLLERSMDGYALMRADPDFDGSCPCFALWVDGVEVRGHCWRSSCDSHTGAGLHGALPPDLAFRLASLMTRMDWGGEWTWA